jgi:hypothetical protein
MKRDGESRSECQPRLIQGHFWGAEVLLVAKCPIYSFTDLIPRRLRRKKKVVSDLGISGQYPVRLRRGSFICLVIRQ